MPRHRLIKIQKTPQQGHPALTSSLEPILVVTMPGVAENFNTVIDRMTFTTDFKHVTCLHTEHVNLTHEDLNTSPNKQENRLNIHLVSYDTSISRAKPSHNGQLSHCSWSFELFDESYQ
jgi:hypothetical protein